MSVSIDIIVQFLRNLACVLKSLSPTNSILNNIPFKDVILSSNPLFSKVNQSSHIEIFIAITQFHGFYSNTSGGLSNISSGYNRLIKLYDLKQLVEKSIISNNKETKDLFIESYIIIQYINNEINKVFYELYILGFLLIFNGFSFLVLTTNSLHIHGSNHPQLVINALIIMEIVLLYFLSIMFNTFYNNYTNVNNGKVILDLLNSYSTITSTDLLLLVHSNGYSNKIYEIINIFNLDYKLEYNGINNDINKLHNVLSNDLIRNNIINPPIKARKLLGIENSSSLIIDIKNYISNQKYHTIVNFIYFLLNVIAFIGYLFGILVYYFPNNKYFSYLYFGLSDQSADWWGVLAGDLSWTIEPALVILLSITNYLFNSNNNKVDVTEITNIPSTNSEITDTQTVNDNPTSSVKPRVKKIKNKQKTT